MGKRKNRPKNSFRIRRFKDKQIHLSYVQGKYQKGVMMGQGAQFIHLVNEDSLRPSLFIFKSAISMIELDEIVPEEVVSKKKLTRREASIKANKQRKQDEELKRVMRRRKGITYDYKRR